MCIHRSLPYELGQPLSFLLFNQSVSIHVFWGICEEQCVTINLAKEIQIMILQYSVIVPYYCTFIIGTMWPNFIGLHKQYNSCNLSLRYHHNKWQAHKLCLCLDPLCLLQNQWKGFRKKDKLKAHSNLYHNCHWLWNLASLHSHKNHWLNFFF